MLAAVKSTGDTAAAVCGCQTWNRLISLPDLYLIVGDGVRWTGVTIRVNLYHSCMLPAAAEGMGVAAGHRKAYKARVNMGLAADGCPSGTAMGRQLQQLTFVPSQFPLQEASEESTVGHADAVVV